jgi:TusA-related sulfurtransferase
LSLAYLEDQEVTRRYCGAVKDMQAFADQTGNPLLSSTEEGGKYIFFMQKK